MKMAHTIYCLIDCNFSFSFLKKEEPMPDQGNLLDIQKYCLYNLV